MAPCVAFPGRGRFCRGNRGRLRRCVSEVVNGERQVLACDHLDDQGVCARRHTIWGCVEREVGLDDPVLEVLDHG